LYYTFKINGVALDTYYVSSIGWDFGDYGIWCASSGVQFTNFAVSTPSVVIVSFTSCGLSDSQIESTIANATGADTSQVIIVERNGCSKKKSTQVAEGVVVSLVGDAYSTSEDLMFKLAVSSDQVSNAVVDSPISSVLPSTVSSTADLAGITAVSVSAIAPTIATGLSTGALAGIIAGSIGGAALIGAGIAIGVKFANKNKSEKPKHVPEPEPKKEEVIEEPKVTVQEPPKKQKPKGATVNIFELDPNDPQSITARSPAIKNNNAV